MRLVQTSLALVGFTVAAGWLAACGSDTSSNPGGSAGSAPVNGSGGKSAGSGGSPVVGGAGSPVVGNAGTSTGTAGTSTGTAGTSTGSGGTGNTAGGSVGAAGSSNPVGGTTSSGGTTASAGGSAAGGGAVDPNAPDQMGKTNAKPGAMTSTNLDYLKLGEMRIINNNWGSIAWKCDGSKSKESVFINADKTFGWNFDRPTGCADQGMTTKPDFPEIEFGIHPFGLGSSDATSPNFSTTTLLPKQIKDITSASVTVTNLTISLDQRTHWDLAFEFWLSSKNPATTQNDAGVYAELMTFWGWNDGLWPESGSNPGPVVRNCNPTPCKAQPGETTSTGGKTYKLEVQDDAWSKWRYYQFRDSSGSHETFPTVTVDVKKLLDYLVTKGYSKDLYVTRFEVGSEIDDGTKGSVKMSNIEFEVNGEKRSPVFGQ
ncbi:MAG TPA: hypothetical protein VFK05_09095 [Polyangiaceae bacterium]|nr:hypothetical protein [Polyangiaceae bacterium]